MRPRLLEGAQALGVALTSEQADLLVRHAELLLKWNKSINLTAITAPNEVVEKHLLDSVAVARFVPPGKLLDAGTGGGFPGLPIRVLRPDVEPWLVDSVGKKVAFLKNVLADLKLTGVQAKALRLGGHPEAEGLPRFDAAIARAFTAPAEWLTLAAPYLAEQGRALCLLGLKDEAPREAAGWVLEQEEGWRLPFSGSQRRVLVYRRA